MTHHNAVFAQMLKFIPTCLSLPAAGRQTDRDMSLSLWQTSIILVDGFSAV